MMLTHCGNNVRNRYSGCVFSVKDIVPVPLKTSRNRYLSSYHNYYMEQFRDADFDLIMGSDGVPIGRLYLEERDDEFRVIDIALLPAWRGKGIGGRIMLGIHDRAFAAGKAVRIHVEQHNPAMRLYHRLGFKKVEDRGIYHLMEALPSSSKRALEPAA